MKVVDAAQRSLPVVFGRCRAVRLLHFAAAPPRLLLTLKRQVSIQESLATPATRAHVRGHAAGRRAWGSSSANGSSGAREPRRRRQVAAGASVAASSAVAHSLVNVLAV
jgi:hypothetical protein